MQFTFLYHTVCMSLNLSSNKQRQIFMELIYTRKLKFVHNLITSELFCSSCYLLGWISISMLSRDEHQLREQKPWLDFIRYYTDDQVVKYY